MPKTRAQLGNLPVPPKLHVYESGEETEIEEMPSKAVVSEEKLPPIFEGLTTKKKLTVGLYMVRPLGGDKYEIVDIHQLDQQQFSSLETGQLIKNDPARLDSLKVVMANWADSHYKVEQGLRRANDDIFRLKDLPIELRQAIYKLVVGFANPIYNGKPTYNGAKADYPPGLGLMSANKFFYKELQKIFWENTFRIRGMTDYSTYNFSLMTENLQHVAFVWFGWVRKDKATMKFLGTCEKLRTMKLIVTRAVIRDKASYNNRQKLCQDDDSVEKFRQCNGWDTLVSMRGLTNVSVDLQYDARGHYLDQCNEAERLSLESFLNKKICAQVLEKEAKLTKKAKRVSKKNKQGVNSDGSDWEESNPKRKRKPRKNIQPSATSAIA